MAAKLTPEQAMAALAALTPADEDLTAHWYIGRRERNVQAVLARAAAPHSTGRAAPGRRLRAWWYAVPAATAAAAAAILLLPGAIGPRPMEAVPSQTPSRSVSATPAPTAATGVWEVTSPSPLSPRHDSLALWVDDSFVVVGGTPKAPCADLNPGNCAELSSALRDGAVYNPDTDQWRRIADAPKPVYVAQHGLSPNIRAAAVGRTLYTVSQHWGFLSYNLDTDTWQRLPEAPLSAVSYVSAWGQAIVAFPFPSAVRNTGGDPRELTYEVFQPSTGRWAVHATGQEMPSQAASGVVVGDTLVVSAAVDDDDSVWVALVDLPTGQVTIPTDQPIATGVSVPAALPNGLAAWSTRDEGARVSTAERVAWFLEPVTETWTSVRFPETVGPLVGGSLYGSLRDAPASRPWPLAASGLVALRGHLYDPTTGLWSRNNDLPGPRIDVVYASGENGILTCWGYRKPSDASPQAACYFLRPAPATSKTP